MHTYSSGSAQLVCYSASYNIYSSSGAGTAVGGLATITTTSTAPYLSTYQFPVTYNYTINTDKIKTLEDVIEILSIFEIAGITFNVQDLDKKKQFDFIALKGLIKLK